MDVLQTVLLLLTILFAGTTVGLVVYLWNLKQQPSVIDSLNDGVITLDNHNQIVALNQTAESMLGRSAGKVIGRNLGELLPTIAALLPQGSDPATAAGELIRGEVAIGANGTGLWYDAHIITRTDRSGHFVDRVVTLHDITPAKEFEHSLQNQKELFESVVKVARATAERPSVEETLQNTLQVAVTLTGAEYSSLFLLDKTGAVTHSLVASGTSASPGQPQIFRRMLDRGLAGWVARYRELAIVDDTEQDPRWLTVEDGRYTARSALGVPIVSGSSVLGILTLIHSQPDHFRHDHASIMQAAADQMALAVRNAQLYDEQRLLAGRQATLYELLRSVGGLLDPAEVSQSAVETLVRLTDWPAAAILLPGEKLSELIVEGAAGTLAERKGSIVSVSEGVIGRAIRLNETEYVTNVADYEGHDLRLPDTKTELVIPLQRAKRMLGLLNIQHNQDGALDNDESRQLASSLADAIALALDNARFYTAMRKHAADLNALYSVNRMIGRSLVLEEMLSKALYSSLTSMGYGFGIIALVDQASGQLIIEAERGVPQEFLVELQDHRPESAFPAYAFNQSNVFSVGDIEQTDDPFVAGLQAEAPAILAQFARFEVRACVGIPLLHQRQSLGILCMFSRNPRQTPVDDQALQTAIGQQIAMAVSNSRLFRTIVDERSLLQAIIKASRDGIVLIGSHSRILVANQQALDFLGLRGLPQDWIGQPLMVPLMAMRHQSPNVVYYAIEEMRRLQQDFRQTNEGEFGLSGRSFHWLNLPVLVDGKPLGRLLVLRDVSHERLLDQVREDLLHTMVHDLRNPLTNIHGSLDFLKGNTIDVLNPEQSHILDIALEGSRRMVGLVNAILDINRLESGHMPLDQAPVSVTSLAKEVIQVNVLPAEKKRLHLENGVSEQLPLAWADASLFQRVLQNLVGNAIKFTPEGGTIGIEARVCEGSRRQLEITVSDTGPGIPLEYQERIFEKFTTGRHDESGSGLGLAFCKMVVEAHGGRIWVSSLIGEGATFHFTMPMLPAAGA